MENRLLFERIWGRVYLRLVVNMKHIGLGLSCDFEDAEEYEWSLHAGPFQLWLGRFGV